MAALSGNGIHPSSTIPVGFALLDEVHRLGENSAHTVAWSLRSLLDLPTPQLSSRDPGAPGQKPHFVHARLRLSPITASGETEAHDSIAHQQVQRAIGAGLQAHRVAADAAERVRRVVVC